MLKRVVNAIRGKCPDAHLARKIAQRPDDPKPFGEDFSDINATLKKLQNHVPGVIMVGGVYYEPAIIGQWLETPKECINGYWPEKYEEQTLVGWANLNPEFPGSYQGHFYHGKLLLGLWLYSGSRCSNTECGCHQLNHGMEWMALAITKESVKGRYVDSSYQMPLIRRKCGVFGCEKPPWPQHSPLRFYCSEHKDQL